MPRSRVINPDGKGPRIWCGRCKAWVPAEQGPWGTGANSRRRGATYVAKSHEHATKV